MSPEPDDTYVTSAGIRVRPGIWFRPARTEPRGQFPRHSDRVGKQVSGKDAARAAAKRLADWKACHGQR